jgi:hypothetical protein
MGEDYIKSQFNVPAANARREGATLFELVIEKMGHKKAHEQPFVPLRG